MGLFDAVIFDMDGTLVESLLDFKAIRAELGIDSGDGIIEAIAAMPAERGRLAHRHLLSHELRGARAARLIPGARQAVLAAGRAGLKTALLTRNARRAMKMVLSKFPMPFDLTWAREDGPIKPEPDGVLAACRELGASPGRTVCVGDFRYDVEAANAAGAVSVLLAVNKDLPDFADQADHVITEMTQLLDILGIQ